MSAYEVEFEMKIHVAFSDEEAAKAFFIDSEWKTVFWAFDNIEDLTRNLAHMFYIAPFGWSQDHGCDVKFVEGFGEFRCVKFGEYVLSSDTLDITIRVSEELQPMFIDKVAELEKS